MSADVAAIAAALGFPGIWFLNGSYEWGCTAAARDEDGAPWLARTLDWPYPGLGRHLEVARMRGTAGEFFNVTWPGYVGVLTASAPGRFAAAINQAPLRRRTRQPWLRPFDVAVNALRHLADPLLPARPSVARGVRDLPRFRRGPAPARDRADRASGDLHAGRLRARRTLRDRAHREEFSTAAAEDTAAANDWLQQHGAVGSAGRHPASCLTRSSEEAAARSRARQEALAVVAATVRAGGFCLGDAAGAQPVHPHRGGDVSRRRHVARGRLRAGGGRRIGASR